jgi:hypothetical protein
MLLNTKFAVKVAETSLKQVVGDHIGVDGVFISVSCTNSSKHPFNCLRVGEAIEAFMDLS